MEIITTAGAALVAKKQAEKKILTIDTFVFANIPGQKPEDSIDPARGLPPADQIVYRTEVTDTGIVDANSVVYSCFLHVDQGPFYFNTLYLLASDDNDTVFAIATLGTTKKTIPDITKGIRGNTITRNFVITFAGAGALTDITIPAAAWQYDINQSTELRRGLIEIATQSETDAGTDDKRVVTPLKLKESLKKNVPPATETAAGIIEIATQGETDAGTDDERVVTPLKLKELLKQTATAISTGQNSHGRWRRWSDGFLQQWGEVKANKQGVKVFFPVVFSDFDTIFAATGMLSNPGNGYERALIHYKSKSAGEETATTTYLYVWQQEGAWVQWFAMGY